MNNFVLLLLLTISIVANINVVEADGPMCAYMCDDPRCHATCQPLCEEARCTIISNVTLVSDTGRAECETICPGDSCNSNTCPACITRCERPFCGTGVAWCQIECLPPVCMCQCRKPSSCPQPRCELKCERHLCGVDSEIVDTIVVESTQGVMIQSTAPATTTTTTTTTTSITATTTEKKKKHKKHHHHSLANTIMRVNNVFTYGVVTLVIFVYCAWL